jgi:hypothetical protein
MVKDKAEAMSQQLLNHDSRLIETRLTRDIGFCCEVVVVLFSPAGRADYLLGMNCVCEGDQIAERSVLSGGLAIGDNSFAWPGRLLDLMVATSKDGEASAAIGGNGGGVGFWARSAVPHNAAKATIDSRRFFMAGFNRLISLDGIDRFGPSRVYTVELFAPPLRIAQYKAVMLRYSIVASTAQPARGEIRRP